MSEITVAAAVSTPRSFDDRMVVARDLAAGDGTSANRAQRTGDPWLTEHPTIHQCWAMFRCFEQLDEIDAWRARLPAPERARLIRPARILARILAGEALADGRDERIARLEGRIIELRDEIARLRARE